MMATPQTEPKNNLDSVSISTKKKGSKEKNQQEVSLEAPKGRGCFYIEGLVRGTLVIASIFTMFAIEFFAALLYIALC